MSMLVPDIDVEKADFDVECETSSSPVCVYHKLKKKLYSLL